ncbi:tRNA 2-thiouridine synthesizing protein C [Halalkaliarchaeum desulfuricum]|uniref:tRNA 2-thiouridine synthesizing protein C n=1 Tax=Halalkaliarchaeum desulfuricum TaxID=2055893 RepID=A0A343TLZ7_9EURY|nr:tRNA 2-thiouridine synthesizing protein C [Halalkaliarchaeum desulfuricum]
MPEGIRAAYGVASGFDRHDVTVLFTEDSVYAAREAADRDALDMDGHVAGLVEQDGNLAVDAGALDSRGIDAEDVDDDIDVLTEDRVAELFEKADHVLTF